MQKLITKRFRGKQHIQKQTLYSTCSRHLTNVHLSYPSHEWKNMFVLGKRAGACRSLIFWERQVNGIRFLLYSLLQCGPFSAQPTHVVCGSFTTAVGKKVREDQVHVYMWLSNCSVGTWILGPEALRVSGASCIVSTLLCFPALQILSCAPDPALTLKRLTTVECITSLLCPLPSC